MTGILALDTKRAASAGEASTPATDTVSRAALSVQANVPTTLTPAGREGGGGAGR